MAVIGTVRIEEARTYDSEAGFHQFKDESGEEYGSFEVFWSNGELTPEDQACEPDALADMTEEEWLAPGWYWVACFPGCLPDGEPTGPFAYSQQAKADALEEGGWFEDEEG